MKKIGAIINDSIADSLSYWYKSCNAGAMRALDSWVMLRDVTIKSLRGYFIRLELDHLIHIQRNLEFVPRYAAMNETILLRLKQQPLNKELNFKIEALDCYQSLFLTDWIDTYFHLERTDPDALETYIEELINHERTTRNTSRSKTR